MEIALAGITGDDEGGAIFSFPSLRRHDDSNNV